MKVSIRVDEQVITELDARRDGKPYNQILRSLLKLPEIKHNKPRKRRSKLMRAIRVLIK